MQVEPGTAQNIPETLRWVILGVSIVAVLLTCSFSKIMEVMRGRSKKKKAEAQPLPKK